MARDAIFNGVEESSLANFDARLRRLSLTIIEGTKVTRSPLAMGYIMRRSL